METIPDAPARLVPPGPGHPKWWLAIVDSCPYCGRRHTHRAGTDGTALGLRVAHCPGDRRHYCHEYRLTQGGT